MNYDGYCVKGTNDRFIQPHQRIGLWQWVSREARILWAMRRLRRDIARERKELSELPDYLLQDIDLRREDADVESVRRPDDLPISRVREMHDSLKLGKCV